MAASDNEHDDALSSSGTEVTDEKADLEPTHNRSDYHAGGAPLSSHTSRIRSHARSPSRHSQDHDVEKEGQPGTPAQQPQRDPNLVDWEGPDDPANPQNWSMSRKYFVTMILGFQTIFITFASSIFSTATFVTAKEFHTSAEVMTLGTSLFVVGFAFGPIVFGPFSELFGRKIPLFTGYFIFIIFQVPVAVAQNIETILVCRFLGGFFGSAPLAVIGGTLADFWDPVNRGIAVCCFAGAVFIGPVAGPIVGGFVTQSYLGWRWTAWFTAIFSAFFGTIAFFTVPETLASVLLSRKAKRLRYQTKNWALHAAMDETPVDLHAILVKYLLRPFAMLFLEPILMLITIYMSLVYGILYLLFSSYPYSFQKERGWNEGVGALPFLAITVGVIAAGLFISYLTKTRFAHKLQKHGFVVPEERLPPMIVGAVSLPISMFWFAWTSSPHITWVPQVISGAFFGFGILCIFMQGFNYIIDHYKMYANSAIAGNTVIRSAFGAGFPLFANQMYKRLGVAWATSLLAFLTLAMVPVPILFYVYGKRIRALSRYKMP